MQVFKPCFDVLCFLSRGYLFVKIWRFTIWRPSVIFHFLNLEIMSYDLYSHAILLPFAKFYWNQTIGCWVMAKNDCWNGGRLPSWILQVLIHVFGNLAVIEFQMCCCLSNFIKIAWFFIEMWLFYYCNMAAIRHIEFSKFRVSRDLYRQCFSVQNFTEIG